MLKILKALLSFKRDCLLNPDLDKEIDVHFSTECNLLDNLIVDYRLGFKFINNGYHIYLKISEEQAEKRLLNAGRKFETHLTLQERNAIFKSVSK
ncbi:MAG: hypothetical protein IPI22_13570 [Bacteroidetes bacterium]|nr:hypothetical protein [Bacteroidota bacterium]